MWTDDLPWKEKKNKIRLISIEGLEGSHICSLRSEVTHSSNSALAEVVSQTYEIFMSFKKSGISRQYSASSELSSTVLCKLEQCWQTPQRYPSVRILLAGFFLPQRLIDFSGSPQKTCGSLMFHARTAQACSGWSQAVFFSRSFPAVILWQSQSPPLWRTHVWHMLPWYLIACFLNAHNSLSWCTPSFHISGLGD